MSNIIERLRQGVDSNEPPDKTDAVMWEAADEIERLRAALSNCRKVHKLEADEGDRLRERYDFQVEANRSLVEATGKAMAGIDRLRAVLKPMIEHFSVGGGKVPIGKMLENAHRALGEKI
jgi:hypothetical protein